MECSHVCLQAQDNKAMCKDRLDVLTAVLKHPNLLTSYPVSLSQQQKGCHNMVDSCTADLVAKVLEHAEAAERAGDGQNRSAWAEAVAATQPYLSRCRNGHTSASTAYVILRDSTQEASLFQCVDCSPAVERLAQMLTQAIV